MSYAQISRIERMNNQPLYLIDKEFQSDNVCKFIIAGSTANIYKVTTNFNQNSEQPIIHCDCPDMYSWAKSDDVKCKHCCFVWIKVLRIPPTWLSTKDFASQQFIILQNSLKDLVVRAELINTTYQEKYKQLSNNSPTTKSPDLPIITITTTNKFAITKDLIDSECPICFDQLVIESSSECPTCHNAVHSICITKWLSMGHKNCVYCRGDWSEFEKKKTIETKSKSKKKYIPNSDSNYLNLDS